MNIDSDQDPYKYFGLDKSKKTILILGGSLGAKSINEGILNNISLIKESLYQLIWQTGKHDEIKLKKFDNEKLIIKDFIDRMDLAYGAQILSFREQVQSPFLSYV